jgi:hypothetical protein
MGVVAIVKNLRAEGVKLSTTGISGILRNEKYGGDMLLQKSFVNNHIEKKSIKNTGQLPQYFVRDSHEPIIPKATFEAVQAEIARRVKRYKPRQSTEVYPLTGMIKCGKCGAPYKRKHAAAGTKYEKIVWICDTFNTLGKSECDSQQIPEDILTGIIAEVGGMENIAAITVPAPFILHFRLKDRDATVVEWSHRSRRESWTEEMREAARQKRLEQAGRRQSNVE